MLFIQSQMSAIPISVIGMESPLTQADLQFRDCSHGWEDLSKRDDELPQVPPAQLEGWSVHGPGPCAFSF